MGLWSLESWFESKPRSHFSFAVLAGFSEFASTDNLNGFAALKANAGSSLGARERSPKNSAPDFTFWNRYARAHRKRDRWYRLRVVGTDSSSDSTKRSAVLYAAEACNSSRWRAEALRIPAQSRRRRWRNSQGLKPLFLPLSPPGTSLGSNGAGPLNLPMVQVPADYAGRRGVSRILLSGNRRGQPASISAGGGGSHG